MRHRVDGKKLNMDSSHRKALNQYMATSFITTGKLTTTFGKLKFVQPYIERLVTKAKVNNLNTFRRLTPMVDTKEARDYLLTKIAPKFLTRNGGYTRLIKLNYRAGDSAPMAKLEWVEKIEDEKNAEKKQKVKAIEASKAAKISKPKEDNAVKQKSEVSKNAVKHSKKEKSNAN